MNTTTFISKFIPVLRFLIAWNFIFSVILILTSCILSVFDDYSFFEFNEDLYGILINSFRFILLYLGLTELVICSYCWFSKKLQLFVFSGFFMILLIGSLRFYAEVNEVEIDNNIPLFLLYSGLSHIAFGFSAKLAAKTSSQVDTL